MSTIEANQFEVLSKFLQGRSRQLVTIDGDIRNLDETWTSILETTIRGDFVPGKPTFVDLSVSPIYYSIGLINTFLLAGTSAQIDVLYSEAEYIKSENGTDDAFPFSFGQWRSVPIPFLAGSPQPSKERHFFVSVGFEGTKTLRILSKSDPKQVTLILPVPGFQPKYDEEVQTRNQTLIDNYCIPDEQILKIPAGDPVEVWRTLSQNIEDSPQQDLYYLCCGTKPHSLGLALSGLVAEYPCVLYNLPERLNQIEIRQSNRYWKYELRDATGGFWEAGGPLMTLEARGLNRGLPFLKWPGGKRWASATIAEVVNKRLAGTYYEPFLGGGAVFFSLCPARAVLSDFNGCLIEVYEQVRDHPDQLERKLKSFPNSKNFYYEMRSMAPRTPIGRAARFLYLNRTAFAGMYRVNRDGGFNVPYGGGERDHRILFETSMLRTASEKLQTVELKIADFEKVLRKLGKGDVAYCDPTYTVAHENNGFRRYNEQNFSWADQERLAAVALDAQKRGATVIVSNAYHASLAKLYQRAESTILYRNSLVSANPQARRPIREFLFLFDPSRV